MDAIVDKTWSLDRIDLLKKLWADGYSASMIAAEIPGATRGAVIGKIHRLGLSGRARKSGIRSAPRPRSARDVKPQGWRAQQATRDRAETGEPAPYLPPEVPSDIPIEQRRTLLQLTESTCRWPYGDPATVDFFFCGAVPVAGQPYCAGHCAIAFNGTPPIKVYNTDNYVKRAPRNGAMSPFQSE